jgi:poly-gamma-glutamate capsule biosynthesis protein CapA/YwtB (metallophosphatase superfamily)
MAGADTSKGGRRIDRRLRIAAAVLWVIAIVLVAVWAVAHYRGGATEAGNTTVTSLATASTTVSSEAPATTSTTLPPTTEAPTTSTSSTTTSATEAPSLTVAAGGDVQGDRKVGTYIDAHGGDSALAKVAPYLKTADLAFINLEGPISNKGSKNTSKPYTFRSRTALADGLATAGIDVVSMANNHAVDWGTSALLDTITRLDAAGVAHAGAGEDVAAARAPALLKTPAGTVAVLAFTDKFTGGYAAGTEHPGVATIGDGAKVIEAVKAAKLKADYVIVSFHWGTEYSFTAASYQRSLAHKVIDAGADLILGHHPHVVQGLEIYKDKLIAYSLGDFLFDHRPGPTGQAFVLRVTMRESGPPVARIIPVYLSDSSGIPAVVTGSSADAVLDRLIKLSAAFGLTVTRSGDVAWIGSPDTTGSTDTTDTTGATD